MDKKTTAIIQQPGGSVDISHHERRCGICGHPERDAIEEAFLQWRSSLSIQLEFHLPSRTTIFRHAHAFALFDRRRRNLRFSLEHIIEGAERVKPTAPGVLRAVHAYTKVTDTGEWVEPPAQVVFSTMHTPDRSRPRAASPPRTLPRQAKRTQRKLPDGQRRLLPAPAQNSPVLTGTRAETKNAPNR